MTRPLSPAAGVPALLLRWLLVAAISFGAFQPRDLVWCWAGSGQGAVEEAGALRCAGASGGACREAPARDETHGVGGGSLHDGCVDVSLRTPARPELARPAAPSPAVAFLPVATPERLPRQTRPRPRDRAHAARADAHDVSLSVVLRA